MAANSPDSDVMVRLAQHRSLSGAPKAEHEWLAAHGRRWILPVGHALMAKGQMADSLHIVFAGHFSIHVDRGVGSHKIYEWGAGDVSGHLPFSRGAVAPNDIIAEEDTDLLSVPDMYLPELIRECPSCTATMVHAMLDRARQFKQSDLHDEKLLSLGKLAAGLAHELNNPASAALRSAKLLGDTLDSAEGAAIAIGVARLAEAQLAAISKVRTLCASAAPGAGLSPIALADREDAIGEWLAAHGANESCAGPLAESGVTLAALDELAAIVDGRVLDAALRLISSGCVVRTLISEIKTATARIDSLVRSVKGFTFMDRAPTPEPVDIRQGIADTFTMLAAKTRAKAVEVSVQLADDLPRAHAVGAELNQVWMNLIDNALDAVADRGHLTVAAAQEHGKVVVRITDDGPGIPDDIKGRIFDPFFTTKEVGKGTGLGLDIVRRILQRHEGEIEVDSRPGHTEFRVVLPRAS